MTIQMKTNLGPEKRLDFNFQKSVFFRIFVIIFASVCIKYQVWEIMSTFVTD